MNSLLSCLLVNYNRDDDRKLSQLKARQCTIRIWIMRLEGKTLVVRPIVYSSILFGYFEVLWVLWVLLGTLRYFGYCGVPKSPTMRIWIMRLSGETLVVRPIVYSSILFPEITLTD